MVSTQKEGASLRGIFAALPTAFGRGGELDPDALRRLIVSLMSRGVEGFYVGGSTGECFLLSERERMESLETVLGTVGGRVPVAAHVGSLSTEGAVALAKHAAKAGVAAVSATPPLYFSYELDEILGYYQDIVQACGLPLLVYNIPAFSGRNFGIQGLTKLLNIPGVVGLKHTSMNLHELERIRTGFPQKIIFSGYDEVFVAASALGADGMIGSTVNLMPELFIAMRKHIREGNIAEARKIQHRVNSVIECLADGSFFPALKYALDRAGFPCGECRRPFQPISEQRKTAIVSRLADFGIAQ